ncbi:MAG: Na(+)-translocating NADH-quinone reductase subunit A [Gammaproteobacteria bacterium]|nr:Na(+)-translocating NADH-quinone reductase subunit A [Gammaproteobacteria bacterium]MBT8150663.1 Na(+)-translocating NADH-quinone reductase subunit A [Gammaproteobacteria bacterium]NND38771.1 Na(+)-translocating NADH-quinone reductase subunit A [Pseudomonadales bacterium]NNM12369.1 Na(+)-translocating NADH-quinone reductase subunit A [Pseudomonadales bacterium]RZV49511.1 MAG: Na(+)-translocating NADH-quinone reductase subunit A [Pseudomonadales bacterium]
MIKIKRGLDLPIGGAPQQSIEQGARARSVALIGFDYVGMKPTMEVTEGDSVKLGQLLFTDKKTPGVRYTAPGAGRVAAINRGEKRALQSVVIELDGDAALSYDAVAPGQLASLSNQAVRERMLDSGAWTALRTRPYSKVPAPDAKPAAIFVTAIDTNPLAADPALIIASRENDFTNGLTILSRLGAEKLFCCTAEGVNIELGNSGAVQETFTGPHPAGLAGTHIHHLCPASSKRSVLWINYQDVIALGVLFSEGRIDVERIVALGGPAVDKPRLLKTRLGASTDELVAGEHSGGDNRVLSGSVFNGRKARGPYAYLGRYHQQVTILPEGRDREFMSYLRAGFNKHSVTRTFISALSRDKLLPFSTTTNGSDRAMVPIGNFEKVMPLDILPTQLLRSLIVGDTASAQTLGCLELDEEDLALCTYVCSGKYEYGPILRDNLTRIEKEG